MARAKNVVNNDPREESEFSKVVADAMPIANARSVLAIRRLYTEQEVRRAEVGFMYTAARVLREKNTKRGLDHGDSLS